MRETNRAQSRFWHTYVIDLLQDNAMYESLGIFPSGILSKPENLLAVNLWCCSEKNSVFKSDKMMNDSNVFGEKWPQINSSWNHISPESINNTWWPTFCSRIKTTAVLPFCFVRGDFKHRQLVRFLCFYIDRIFLQSLFV